MKNNQTPQQPITKSQQRGDQTTPAHLYWCGTDPSSSCPAQDAGHRGNPPKWDYISAIFAGFSSYTHKCVLCTHKWIQTCQNLVHLDSLGPPDISSQPLDSHPSTRIHTPTATYTPIRVKTISDHPQWCNLHPVCLWVALKAWTLGSLHQKFYFCNLFRGFFGLFRCSPSVQSSD